MKETKLDDNISIDERIDKSKLSGKETITYCLGVIPQTILAGIFALTYVNFFWDNLQIQQTYFVLGQMIYMIVNSFNDFFLGRMSDKTNVERWGSRRLIYIKWGGPLWALVFFGMWFPWSYTNQIIIFLHFVISICAFDMFLSLVIMLWMALLPELTENIAERNKIQFFNQVLGSIGAFAVLVALSIFETSLQSFQMFCLFMAIISGVMYFIVGSKLKERPELYKNEDVPGLLKSVKETLKLRSFVSYTAFKFFNFINLAMGLQFVFAYLYIMGFDVFTTSVLYYFTIIIFGWVGSFLYLHLSKKRGMQSLIVKGRITVIFINIIGFLVIIQPGADLLIWVFLLLRTVVGGYGLFGYPYLMLATDDDEVRYGTRREGMFLGANAFIIKFAESLGPIIATSILLAFGFVRDAPSQPPLSLVGIKFLFFVIPTIMDILGLICIYFFPLHGKKLKEMRVKLLTMHEAKAKASK